jgi:hypothetical protein
MWWLITAIAAQFNLACTGTEKTLEPATLTDTVTPFAQTYRIDLEHGKWCDGNCSSVLDIAKVSPTWLTLISENIDTPHNVSSHHLGVDRTSGGLSEADILGPTSRPLRGTFIKAACEVQPFSGFPNPPTTLF